MRYAVLLLSYFIFFSCQANQDSEFAQSEVAETTAGYSTPTESSATQGDDLIAYHDKKEQTKDGSSQSTNSHSDKTNAKKIIRTARIEIEVSDYKKNRENLNAILQEFDAVLQEEQERNLSYRLENTLTIRLAPENLDAFIKSLEATALNVFNKTISARDVTKEFIDMETRLKSKRAVIQRYQELLKQAKSVEEILAVEAQLRQVIEEVESVEGQLKYLKDQVGLSTIYLKMFEKLEQPIHQKRGFFSRLSRSMGDGWSGFLEFLIGVATLWPFWILLFILIALFRRYRRRRISRKQ